MINPGFTAEQAWDYHGESEKETSAECTAAKIVQWTVGVSF